MAWTAPLTWVAQNFTAAIANAHIRDNFNETAPGKATATGRLIVTDGANSIVERIPTQDTDAGSGTGTNSSYLTLANLTGGSAFGGEVEVTVTTGTEALVLFAAQLRSSGAGGNILVSYSVSSATTVSPDDDHAMQYESSNAADVAQFGSFHFRTGLTAGSNVFTLQARVTAGTMTIADPRIFVLPL